MSEIVIACIAFIGTLVYLFISSGFFEDNEQIQDKNKDEKEKPK